MGMARRSPARFLAPIALVAVAVALYTVVQDARDPAGGDTGTPAGATATPKASKTASKEKKSKRKRKTYTVKSGDTLSGIAEKTNVSLETLRDLNPKADTLSPGQKLKLSR
jgi:LysM repeat protein